MNEWEWQLLEDKPAIDRVTVGGVTASTAVPQHPGDIPTGTLRKIESDLAPALGRRWLV